MLLEQIKTWIPSMYTVFGPFTMRIFQARIVPSVSRKRAI